MRKKKLNCFLVFVSFTALLLAGCGGGGGGEDNSARIADAGPDQNVLFGTVVTLDGSGSRGTAGGNTLTGSWMLTYNWSFTSKPAGSSATLSGETTANPTFTVDQAGAYTVQLIVNDGTANSATDSVSITATYRLTNIAPVAEPQPVYTYAETPINITLTGSGTYDVPLTFQLLDNPVNGTLNGTLPDLTYIPSSNFSGKDSFTFLVNGGMANSTTVTVNITIIPILDEPDYMLHAPHNESNDIFCYTCHSGEFIPNGSTLDDIDSNLVCLNCHSDSPTVPSVEIPGPHMPMHSDLVINGTDNWTTSCVDCHDPHFQAQIDWATDPNFFVVTGNISSINLDPEGASSGPLGSSFITYSGMTVISPAWSNPNNWYAKGAAGMYSTDPAGMAARSPDNSRGLLLASDIDDPWQAEIFEVIAADTTTITIKGQISSSLYSGKNFGLFYGQLIRSVGNAPGSLTRDVKFFTPEATPGTYGSYVDDSTTGITVVGLCQVCHEQTIKNWDSGNNHTLDLNCYSCHSFETGFAPKSSSDYHSGDYTTDTDCSTCHSIDTASSP